MAFPRNDFVIPALSKPKECTGCVLEKRGEGFAAVEGTGWNGVIIVGAYLGVHEVEQGLPLRPSSAGGAIFERTCKKLKIPRSHFKIINAIQCMPPEGKLAGTGYEWQALEHCSVHRNKVLLEMPESSPVYKRKVVLAFGEVATKALTGLSSRFDSLRGYPVETPFGLVLPTYNPAKLIAGRDAKLIGVFRKDVQKAVDLARDGWQVPAVDYLIHPTVEQGWEFYERAKAWAENNTKADEPHVFLTYDIENSFAVLALKMEFDWVCSFAESQDEREALAEARAAGNGLDGALLGKVITVMDRIPGWKNGNRIKTVQFSLRKNEAIRFVWQDEFIPIIRAIVALPIEKWGWNSWKHDDKILSDFDCPVAEPRLDGFWLFHHVEPDLTTEDTEDGSGISSRLGLQYAASLHGWYKSWKQLGSDDPQYQCIDVDVLQYMVPVLVAQAKAEGLWNSYLKHRKGYFHIMTDMTRRGIPVNETRRQQVLLEMQGELDIAEAAIQEAYPQELKNRHPEQGFVRPPKWDDESYRRRISEDGLSEFYEWYDSDDSVWRPMELRTFTGLKVKQVQECDCFTLVTTGARGQVLAKPRKVWLGAECPKCAGKKKVTTVLTEQQRWACILPFKPSQGQIVTYMRHVGHAPPKKRGGGGKFTTEFKELERLAERYKNDPKRSGVLYTQIVTKRKLEKMISTYIIGWKPDPRTGCVHPEYLDSTASGQLASVGPNALNPPKHNKKLAEKFRSMIEAPPGRVWVELDFRSFHAATLAALSGDEVYYKVAVKAGDAHSFLASHMVGEPIDSRLSVPELIVRLKDIKSRHQALRDTSAKQANLGYGFGMQGPGLHARYPEYFEARPCAQHGDRKQCGYACEIVQLLNGIFARNHAWRQEAAAQCAADERMLSPFGHHRRFYSIYTWRQVKNSDGEPQWTRQPGDDLEDCYAYGPSNSAHCVFKEVQMDLDTAGVLEKYQFSLAFHDALYMLPLEEEVDECVRVCHTRMTQPIKELAHPVLCPDGLVVEVDVKTGKSWATMKDYDLKGKLGL